MTTETMPAELAPELIASLHPHVIVLFGATGDLARRKLLPGLLPPLPGRAAPRVPDRRPPRSRSSTTTSTTRFARAACDEFARGEVTEDHWDDFRRPAHATCPGSAGPAGLAEAVGTPEADAAGRSPAGCTT